MRPPTNFSLDEHSICDPLRSCPMVEHNSVCCSLRLKEESEKHKRIVYIELTLDFIGEKHERKTKQEKTRKNEKSEKNTEKWKKMKKSC